MRRLDPNAARTLDELPSDVNIGVVEVWDDETEKNKILVVYLADDEGRVLPSSREDIHDESPETMLAGVVQLMYRPDCNAYEVIYSLVSPGWGPMLYDVAMEQATENAGGIMSDRQSVSDAAARVWRTYERREDVEQRELPARRACTAHDPEATKRAFTKPPELSERLGSEGRLLFFDGYPPGAKGGYGSFFDVQYARPKPLRRAAN